MRHLLPATLVLVIAAAAGCRSAQPAVAPGAPAPAAASTPAAPAAASSALGEGSATASLPNAAASAPTPAPNEMALEPAHEEELAHAELAPDSPEALQREALELCQRATELLDEGDVEGAVAASDRAYELMLALPANGDDTYLQAKEDIRLLVADVISRIYRPGRHASGAPLTSWDLGMQILDNEHVRREIRSFTTVERELFLEGYRRSGRYRPMILAKLEAAGLPSQVSWLPLVESWFKVRALSRASALGMWQFISSTGLRYGLSRDAWVDERLDPEKSTDAAIAYLTELHGLFGDWPKALAAYNCGEARVERLSRRGDEYLDFWDLYELLPRETRRYVPRLLAAIQIIENPERYGITLPSPDAPLDGVATVSVERAVKLDSLDAALGLPAGTLQDLNPELRSQATPKRAYALRVPGGREALVAERIAALPEWTRPVPEYATHRVRTGETLSLIAARYGTSVNAIVRANNLRSANRLSVGQRLRIPGRGVRHASSGPAGGATSADGKRYQVARGDTLGKIADAQGVSLGALLRANGLSGSSTIYPGQWLSIPR